MKTIEEAKNKFDASKIFAEVDKYLGEFCGNLEKEENITKYEVFALVLNYLPKYLGVSNESFFLLLKDIADYATVLQGGKIGNETIQ